MTLSEIEDELERRLGYTSSPATAVTTRLRSFVNRAHRKILTRPDLTRLRRSVIPITSTISVAFTGLPFGIEKISSLIDTTNGIDLREYPIEDFRFWDPGEDSTGNPWAFAILSYGAAAFRQPSATGVWAVSTAAGDTMNVLVETIRTGGYPRVEAATALTGTTRVQIGTLTDHQVIRKFYAASAPAGDVSLYDAATAGNELGRIPRGYTSARFAVIRWFPIPSVAVTYTGDIIRRVEEMSSATDEPLLPVDFHDMVIEGALVYEYRIRGDIEQMRETQREFAQRMSDLIYHTHVSLVAAPAGPPKFSQLGPWFEADT